MRVLVTGGCGFIGSAVVRHLINDTDHEVINVDKMTYAATEGSVGEVADNERYRHLKIDICDAAAVEAAFVDHQPDAVMHLAAESHVDRSIDGPEQFLQTNVVGTMHLLQAARNLMATRADGGADFRFLLVSTDEVFGALAHGDEPFTESTPYSPRSPYSASKASADHLARAWAETYGLPVLITNCSNNYGPYQFPEKLIPLFTTNLLDGHKVPLYGDGGNIRDWIHVEDHNRAVQVVLEKGEIGEVYNIGAHNEITNREITYRLLELCGRDESFIEPVADRLGHDRRYSVDIDRISALP